MTNRKFNGSALWDPHAFRVVLAENSLNVSGFHRKLEGSRRKYSLSEVPSLSWCYSYLSRAKAKGPSDPRLTRAICGILGVPHKRLFKKARV